MPTAIITSVGRKTLVWSPRKAQRVRDSMFMVQMAFMSFYTQ